MSTTGERVQVTPELLDRWQEGCADAYGHGAVNVAVPPLVVLALVARIRELESEVQEVGRQLQDATTHPDDRQDFLSQALNEGDGTYRP